MNEKERQSDPYREWLGAYLDGELLGDRQAWVESHLMTCAGCRAALESLRSLGSLLRETPEPAPSTSARAFAAQVIARLPGASEPGWRRSARVALRFAPLGLFGVYAFFQAVEWTAGALLLGLGYLPGMQAALSPLVPFTPGGAIFAWGWLEELLARFDLFGLLDPAGLLIQVPWADPLGMLHLAIIALLVLLFLAWLAGLWSLRRAEGAAR